MGLLTNLGKGFIRSTINQVGRDTGKVISNNIYGDAHSTPYRRVGDNTQQTMIDENTQFSDGAIREIPKSGFWKKCLYAFLLYLAFIMAGGLYMVFPLLVIIPPAIVAYVGYRRSHKEQYYVNIVENITTPTYVPDARYKDGRRYAGDIQQKQITKAIATPEEEEEIIKRAKRWYYAAIIILILGCIGGYMSNTTP